MGLGKKMVHKGMEPNTKSPVRTAGTAALWCIKNLVGKRLPQEAVKKGKTSLSVGLAATTMTRPDGKMRAERDE